VTDTLATRMVIVCISMNVLGKRLHEVLHDARPPDVAGWCQRFLRRRAAVSLIHHAPKSCNLPILIQVVPTIAPWLGRPDRRSFTALPLSSKAAGADSPLAPNQQIERRLRNIHSNATIPPGRHAWLPGRCFVRRPFEWCLT